MYKITNMNTSFSCFIRVILCIMLKITSSIPMKSPHTFCKKKTQSSFCVDSIKCSVKFFKSRLRVIGTKKWNWVMAVSVGYPDTHGFKVSWFGFQPIFICLQ